MIAAVAKPCDTGGKANDPTTYEAWTALREPGGADQAPHFRYLVPSVHRLRSAHLTSADAAALEPRLFDAPFAQGTDPLITGPTGAALPLSPFFMVQIAPTSSSSLDTWGACGELFHN